MGRPLAHRGRRQSGAIPARAHEIPFRPLEVDPAILAKIWQGDPVAPEAYRDGFPARWARFLVAAFGRPDEGGLERAAIWAGRDERTLRYQFAGRYAGGGDLVARAALTYPAEFRAHCGDLGEGAP